LDGGDKNTDNGVADDAVLDPTASVPDDEKNILQMAAPANSLPGRLAPGKAVHRPFIPITKAIRF
jgi:hypothetical protein